MVSPAGSGFGTLDPAPKLVFTSVVPGVTPWRVLFLCDGFNGNDRALVERTIREYAQRWLSEAPFYGQGLSVQFWLRFASSTDGIITADRLRNFSNIARTWYGFAFRAIGGGSSGLDNARVAADLASSEAMLGVGAFDSCCVFLNTSQGYGLAATTYFIASLYQFGIWAHELGHTHRQPPVIGLADEYWGQAAYVSGEPNYPNVTANYARPNKWDALITATNYPTKLSPNLVAEWTESMADGYKPGDIGGFEGGWNYGQGILRPAVHCRMHDGAEQPWCRVCAAALRSNLVLPFSSQAFTQRLGDFSLTGAPAIIAERWMPPNVTTSVSAATSIANNYLLIPRDGWLRSVRVSCRTALAVDTLQMVPEVNGVALGPVVTYLPGTTDLVVPITAPVEGGQKLSTRILQTGLEESPAMNLHLHYLFESAGGF